MPASQYRLAIRSSEHMVSAYFAEEGTMEHALLLTTMSRDIAERWPKTFDAWKVAALIMFENMRQPLEPHLHVESFTDRAAPPVEIKPLLGDTHGNA